MIDLHNHLLPGLDDGPAAMDEALALARLALADGVTHLLCTPHMNPGVYDNDAEGINAGLKAYREALQSVGIDLAVAAAAEVRFGLELMQQAEAGTLPFLGRWQGQDVLLLEFPHTELPFGAERLTEWLLERDIRPMIAHPERNRDLLNSPERLQLFVDQGCLLQVTANALDGRFGDRSQALAAQLVIDGVVHCLASDAHNTHSRPPCMSAGAAAVEALAGAEAAAALTHENPWEIARWHFT